ncbi:MAG TPA: arginase family protein [Humibacter sp.]|nr:arginase family protein [Humibacter sp.]
MTHFLVVPQWQGSGSSRAMRLIDGAQAIAGDLPTSSTTAVDVPMEAGEMLDTGVQRYSALVTTRDRTLAALVERAAIAPEETVITIGGDCAADLAGVQHALSLREPGSVALVWFDAHADINSPQSSPSRAFSGMVVRALLGEGPAELASAEGALLAPQQLVLAGTRSLDDGESAYIDENGIRMLTADRFASPDALLDALSSTGATSAYLHIDLDVLDPAAIDGVGYPEPFGLQPELLAETIRSVRSRYELAGAAVTGFAPATQDAANGDLSVILRTLGALTAPLR